MNPFACIAELTGVMSFMFWYTIATSFFGQLMLVYWIVKVQRVVKEWS